MDTNNTSTVNQKNNTKTLLGILVIVLILLAVMVFANNRKMKVEQMTNENMYQQQAPVDEQIEVIRVQSDSDEVDSIEADLNSTSIDSLEL